MKKSFLLLFFIFLMMSMCFSVSAHPGSLDENGGHYNRTTGEYHYHDGTHTESDDSTPIPDWVILIGLILIYPASLLLMLILSIPSIIIDKIKDWKNTRKNKKRCLKKPEQTINTEKPIKDSAKEEESPIVSKKKSIGKNIAIIFLTILVIGLAGLNVYQYRYLTSLTVDDFLDEDEMIVESDIYFELLDAFYEAEEKLDFYNENEEKLDFYNENIVFVIDGFGNYYYTYDEMEIATQALDEYYYWAYNLEQAESLGYEPLQ